MRYDVNRSLENSRTRTFTMIVIGTSIGLIFLFLFVALLTGRGVKTPIFEVPPSVKNTMIEKKL